MTHLEVTKDEVIIDAEIELERMFGVLTNTYSHPKYSDHALVLPDIEMRLKAALQEIRPT